MPRDYVYDQGFSQERTRLAGIESLWDPGTQALLDDLGIGPAGGAWKSAPAAARCCSG
ncbi:putative methyltransferase domain protein [Mycobacterium kansasii]|uniref:Putative methyltransferase domain protein n=1 Tax=Mycobacterium kansasii TaxID=1768 RepID=A0A1V3XU98_MYCKA|nr:putative methyltransferase domain protein [Mycobacterium kansasii]